MGLRCWMLQLRWTSWGSMSEKAPETETESDTVPLDGDVGTNIISTMPQGPMHSSDNTQDLVHHLKTGIQVHTMANFTNVDDPDEEKFGGASLSPSGSCMTRSSSIDLTIEELLKADGNISEEVRNAPLVNKGAELNRSIESVKVGIVMPEAGAVKLEGKSRYGALLGQGEDGEPIDCPCGVNEEDGDMIFCARCKAWGHLACAGYRKATDKRIAKTHLCYACQNETGTGDMVYDLEYVAEVALFRRGIHVAFTDGITSISEFASGLGVGLPQAKQILGRLVKEGFVAEAKSGKGKKKSGPQYQVLKTSAAGGRHSKWFSKAPFTEYAARKEKLQAMRGSSVAKHSSHTHLSEQLSGRNTPLPDPQLLNTVDTGHRDVTPDADSTQQIITRAKSRSASVASTAFTQSGLFVNRTPVSKTSGQLPTPLAKPPTAAKIDDIVENTESIRHQFLQQVVTSFTKISRHMTRFIEHELQSTDRQMTGFALNKTTDDATRGDVFTSKRAAPEENIKTLEAKRRKVSVVTKPLSVL
ncbi:hypothetical protein DFJ77DRAFT_311355 [Powellomyces hirtus]|nr:hypothetical protein DFJ77DRAFT_311355 [Powellomyces hirtus]